MALTNILREPRRELTETVVGLALVGPLVVADYYFAAWLQSADHEPNPLPIPLGMILGVSSLVGCVAVLVAVLMVVHVIGEALCDSLARHGRELRPRQGKLR